MSGHDLTRAHRANLINLNQLAERDLSAIWAHISTEPDATVIKDYLAAVLPSLVAVYGAAAASLGADYYDEMRALTPLQSRFTALTAELPDDDRTDSLAGWAVAPLFDAQPDHAAALTLAAGGVQRIVTNASRDSIKLSATADPHEVTWVRTVYGGACDYCRGLAGTDNTSAHDHCNCGVEPKWSGADTAAGEVSADALLTDDIPAEGEIGHERDTMLVALREHGGFTIDPRTGADITDGFAVALPNMSSITPAPEFFANADEIVHNWLIENAAVFDDPAVNVGGWWDKAHDEIVLDPSVRVANREEAIALGIRHDQQAIYDIAGGAEIDTGGTGQR